MVVVSRRLPARFLSHSIKIAALFFFLYLVELFLLREEQQRLVATDVTAPLINIFAVAGLYLAAYYSLKNTRRSAMAWRFCFLAQFFYLAGDIAWAILEAGFGIEPFPSIADVFYIIFYPLLFIGILLLSERNYSREEWMKKGLDIAIITIASLLIFWNFFLGPLAATQMEEPFFTQALGLAYPIGDMLILWALFVLLYNGSCIHDSIPILLLGTGTLVMVLTDSAFSIQSISGMYVSGGVIDIGWTVVYLLFGLAGISQAVYTQADIGLPKQHVLSGLFRKITLAIPYMLLIGAFALLVHSYLTPMPMGFFPIACGVALTIGLVLLRQMITLAENTRLVRQLNLAVERVQNQAAEVEQFNQDLQIEIAGRKRMESQLAHDALHDGLTGLPNRVLFMDRLEHAIAYGKRHPENSFAVLFLDLDHFKVVNDSLGHPVGDKLLIILSQRLSSCLRKGDTLARVGGDELVVLLEDAKDENSVVRVADCFQAALREPFYIQGKEVFTTASIGIIFSGSEYTRADEILRDVDIAMYHAKAQGKARYAIFRPEMRNQAMLRLELENEIRCAIENKEFELYYQPIYKLWPEKVAGFEALIRWNHPKRGMLLPDAFLPIAEESDLILTIGEWVLRQACGQLSRWHAAYPHLLDLTVNVNISSKQIAQHDFVEKVQQALQETGLKPQALKLEITETAVIQNQVVANAFFTRLNQLGIQLQVDDFGTGYSSLSYLQHFPIHCIKIDRSFIQEIGKPGKNADLVRTMIMMAKDLGMEAIAEGIETEEQLRQLEGLSCKFGQGFLLSRPMDERGAENILRDSRESVRSGG